MLKLNGKMVAQPFSWIGLDKIKHRDKRLRLLTTANDAGLRINALGGVGFYDRDVQWLLKRGYIEVTRVPYGNGWARDLSNPYKLRRTIARPTEAGRDVLAIGRFPN
jgi:hypothetical protein